MEEGKVISKEELIAEGWERKDYFGNFEIWVKGEGRILYDPKIRTIYRSYEMNRP